MNYQTGETVWILIDERFVPATYVGPVEGGVQLLLYKEDGVFLETFKF